MLLPENLSPIFTRKSKSSSGGDGIGARKASHNIIEHDVTGLTIMSNLPTPDSFEALQIGSDR
jgi:hypothetical protein